MMRALAAAIVLAVLTVSAQAEQHRPDLVRPGMTPQQVEAVVGKSIETCRHYTSQGEQDGVCFRDGRLSMYRADLGLRGDETEAEVKQLIKFDSVSEIHLVGNNLYRAYYVNGLLEDFEFMKPPPLH